MDIQAQIADLAAPGALDAGLVVDGVQVAPAGKRTVVRVTVDLPPTEIGSAELDDVALASRAISAALDEANVPSTPYVLEVSTPGTDRPLTEPHHFMRARTRMVDLILTDGTRHQGRLTEATDAALTLDKSGTHIEVPLASVESGAIVVELKRPDTPAAGG